MDALVFHKCQTANANIARIDFCSIRLYSKNMNPQSGKLRVNPFIFQLNHEAGGNIVCNAKLKCSAVVNTYSLQPSAILAKGRLRGEQEGQVCIRVQEIAKSRSFRCGSSAYSHVIIVNIDAELISMQIM